MSFQPFQPDPLDPEELSTLFGDVGHPFVDRRPRFDGVPVDRLPDPLPEVRRGERRAILPFGAEPLQRPAGPVTEFGSRQLRQVIDNMFATMVVPGGFGLAANQIGVDLQVLVYDCPDAWGVRHVGHLTNPIREPLLTPAERAWRKEGCLSVPGATADIARPNRIILRGQDLMGKPAMVQATGRLARCLQHEVDHLNGVLFVDYLAVPERRRVLREMAANQQTVWAEWDSKARRGHSPGTGPRSPYHP